MVKLQLDPKQILETDRTPCVLLELINSEYRVLFGNKAFMKAMPKGESFEEAMTIQRLSELIYENPTDQHLTQQILNRCRDTQKTINHNFKSLRLRLENMPASIFNAWSVDFTPLKSAEGSRMIFLIKYSNYFEEMERDILIKNTQEPYVLIDLNMDVAAHNTLFYSEYKRIFNREIEIGKSILDYAQPERRNIVKNLYDRVFKGESIETEIGIPLPDGKTMTIRNKYLPLRNNLDQIIGAFVTVFDVSDKKETEELLQKSEKQFRALVENGGDAVVIFNSEAKPTYVSPSISRILGYSAEEALKLDVFSIIHKDDVEVAQAAFQTVLDNPGIPVAGHTTRMLHKNGSWKWIEPTVTNLLLDPDVSGIVDNLRDVTEVKTAEEKLTHSLEKYQSLVQTVDGVVWEAEAKTLEFKYISPQVERILGYTPDEWLADKSFWQNHIFVDDREHAISYCKKQIEKGNDHQFEYRMMAKNGGVLWIRDIVTLIYENGRASKLRGIMINITETRVAQDLRDFERANKEAIINSTEDLIWSVSAQMNLITANDGFKNSLHALTGIVPQPGDNVLMQKLIPKDLSSQWRTLYDEALKGNKLQVELQTPYPDKSGELVWYETRMNPIYKGNSIIGVACYSRNITDKKRAEEQLLKSNSRLKTAQTIAKLGYWEFNTVSSVLFWSEEVYRIWEMNSETDAITYDKFISSIHPDDLNNFHHANELAASGQKELDFEHRILLKNGKIKWVHEKGKLHKNRQGELVRYEGTVQDITEQKLAFDELLRQKVFIETALDNLPIGIAVNEIDSGMATLMNKKFTEIYGWPEADLMDVQGFFEKVYPDPQYRSEMTTRVLADIQSKDPSRMQWHGITITTKSGEKRIINAKNIPIWDQNLMISSVVDVTEEVQAKEEKLRILESISDAFYALNKNWEFSYVNKEAENLLKKRGTELIGKEIWSALDIAENEAIKVNLLAAAQSPQSQNFELFHDGLEQWFEYSVYPNENGLSVYFKNITERKNYEKKLKTLNRDLKKRAEELALSNADLEQFAYVASHDLQEPLRMVTSFLMQLEKKYSDRLDDRAHKYINFAVDGAVRMRRIILDLLEYSRVGRQGYHDEKIDLNELIMEVIEINGIEINESQARIAFDNLPIINAPHTAIQQVFQNLISNSLKYRKKDVPPEIHISCEESTSDWKFTVSDNGIGIEPQFFDKIFVIFQRLHGRSAYSGTGIGLAITKKIIEHLGGQIHVESELGKGTSMCFTIKKPA